MLTLLFIFNNLPVLDSFYTTQERRERHATSILRILNNYNIFSGILNTAVAGRGWCGWWGDGWVLDLSITTDPGIGPGIDQEKTLCGTAE